jgi:arginyl-tRNA--protein-N-Asp/Glu arginylyltransferase
MDEVLAKRLPPSLPILRVLENVHPCSYLADRTANMPLILPSRYLSTDEFDQVLAHGLRRSGYFTYLTTCDGCKACEPTRVEVARFRWSYSWRRILKRGDQAIQVHFGELDYSDEKLRLFNMHRNQRELGQGDREYEASDYEGFLVDTCCDSTIEIQFRKEDQLVAVSIVDCGTESLSAVYTYFDPQFEKLSLGTYAILKQMQLAENTGRKYVYLGLYVAENQHLNYKARFTPQERLIDGQWVTFE